MNNAQIFHPNETPSDQPMNQTNDKNVFHVIWGSLEERQLFFLALSPPIMSGQMAINLRIRELVRNANPDYS
jgi:hypothetical protein